MSERRAAGLPPFAHLALLRAEAHKPGQAEGFLDEACSEAERLLAEQNLTGIELLGPVPAPMERRAGRYRAQLLLQATARAPLHRLLSSWLLVLEQMPSGRAVRGRWMLIRWICIDFKIAIAGKPGSHRVLRCSHALRPTTYPVGAGLPARRRIVTTYTQPPRYSWQARLRHG